MVQPEIYFLAGLGFDKRIFYNLRVNSAKVHYLRWLEPEHSEPLDDYVNRISQQIKPTIAPIILVGHSFGGMIVQRISSLIKCSKVIIISSIKSKDEIPISFKILKRVPMYKFVNKEMILKSFPVWARLFGYNSEKGRMLFNLMIGNSSNNYFRWSMDKIVNIEFMEEIHNLVHIHGTRDKTFPINKIKDPIMISDGSHFMVFSKAKEVSEVLNREISIVFETLRS